MAGYDFLLLVVRLVVRRENQLQIRLEFEVYFHEFFQQEFLVLVLCHHEPRFLDCVTRRLLLSSTATVLSPR